MLEDLTLGGSQDENSSSSYCSFRNKTFQVCWIYLKFWPGHELVPEQSGEIPHILTWCCLKWMIIKFIFTSKWVSDPSPHSHVPIWQRIEIIIKIVLRFYSANRLRLLKNNCLFIGLYCVSRSNMCDTHCSQKQYNIGIFVRFLFSLHG